ncbi:MAG: hypothetical protein P8Z76_19750, partial [Alphaproteobacteria bacterium]
MKKLLLSTALAAGIGAFALQPTAALADHGDGALNLTNHEALAIGAYAVHALQPWGNLQDGGLEGRTQLQGSTYPNADGDSPSVKVTAWVEKDKDIRILELIAKLKVAVILVARVFRGNSGAESDLVVEQENTFNNVQIPPYDGDGPNVTLRVTLRDSVVGNTGIVQINQDAGNMANQGNMLSAAVAGAKATFADAQAAAEQINSNNVSFIRENGSNFTPADAQKRALIANSINRNAGVVLA